MTEDECKEAAKKLSVTLNKPDQSEMKQGILGIRGPKGCSYRTDAGFSFNDHLTGGLHQSRAPVCKLGNST